LPAELYQKYTAQFGLSTYDAAVITADYHLAQYFETAIKHTKNYKAAANWLMGPLKSVLDHHSEACIKPEQLAGMIKLVDDGKINHTIAANKLLPELLKSPGKTAEQVAAELNLFISESGDELDQFIKGAILKFPDKVAEYQKGKKGVLGLFMGEIMKQSKGKIDPQKTNQLLVKALETK